MMNRKIQQIVWTLMAIIVLMPSCMRDEDAWTSSANASSEDYLTINFTIDQSDLTEIDTRSVDPDGQDINNISLFCFTTYGLFMAVALDVKLESQESDGIHETRGEYTAKIPTGTTIIHFLANQNPNLYTQSDFINKTEAQVLGEMEGASGMMIYWNRFEWDPTKKDANGKVMDIKEQLEALDNPETTDVKEGIELIRNQAKVTVEVSEDFKNGFEMSGFVVANIHAFGTVAPYCKEHGFIFHKLNSGESHNMVTLPVVQTMMSDITDTNTKTEDYIFEHENALDNPVSIIVKGKHTGETQESYYRAMLINHETGDLYPVVRNHHYKVKIVGNLSYGKPTFEEALNGPATNNVWISVDSWVKEVADNQYELSLAETSKVFDAANLPTGGTYQFDYTLKKASGNTDTEPLTAPQVTWLDGNNVANNVVNPSFDPSTGRGTIEITLAEDDVSKSEQTGTLLIRKARLYRTIDISMISTQKFTPSWVDSQIYGGETGENVTLMFTIPETCPKSLFPFSVLISANELDVRNGSGMQLPVLKKGDSGFFGNNAVDYKYEYVVREPGSHRVYLHTILQHEENSTVNVQLEAHFFETITKTVAFKNSDKINGVDSDPHRMIFLENIETYGDNLYAEDEQLYYMLVPQKKASPHMFTIALKERDGAGEYVPLNHNPDNEDEKEKNGNDEFLIYTQKLIFYDQYFEANPERYDIIQDQAWECQITEVNESSWSTNGRVMGIRTFGYGEENIAYPLRYGLQDDGTYHVFILTNGTDNRDVVRIASNSNDNPYVFQYPRDQYDIDGKLQGSTPYPGDAQYGGNEYRSFIFDVSHYRPFRFAAQVKIGKDDPIPAATDVYSNQTHKDAEEPEHPMVFTYVPNQQVDIMLDVTSFKGQDGRSVHPFGEEFGEAFDIYIDAPMLEIDYDRLSELYPSWDADKINKFKGKFRKISEGRFAYRVDQMRATEREYGYAPALVEDDATSGYDKFGGVIPVSNYVAPGQEGERKLLPFRKKSITANGDIVISSDEDQVVYWTKTFNVSTERIKGLIQYNKEVDGGDPMLTDVPKDAFVSVVYRPKYEKTRIGSMTVGEVLDGKNFSLNLRSEYSFEWNGNNPIELNYKDVVTGINYDIEFDNLEALYNWCLKKSIVLNKATDTGFEDVEGGLDSNG